MMYKIRDGWMDGWMDECCLTSQVNSQGHVKDEAETLILPVPGTLFEKYEGPFYMHCPIDRAAHTWPLITSHGHWQEWKVAQPPPGGELTQCVRSTPVTIPTV
jgi:hypothetical protein